MVDSLNLKEIEARSKMICLEKSIFMGSGLFYLKRTARYLISFELRVLPFGQVDVETILREFGGGENGVGMKVAEKCKHFQSNKYENPSVIRQAFHAESKFSNMITQLPGYCE